MAEVPRRLKTAVTVGAVLVVLLLVLGTVLVLLSGDDDDAALQVDTWAFTRAELEQRLEDLTGNRLYLQARERQGEPVPVPAEGEEWDPALVAEVLNDELTIRLAEVALGRRGEVVLPADKAAARDLLRTQVMTDARLTDATGSDALDIVLDQFGPTGEHLEQGTATVVALRRVLAQEKDIDPRGSDADDLLLAELRATAATVTIVVAPDLGTWDAASAVIVAVSGSEGGLEPLAPGEPLDPSGTAPALPVPSGDPAPAAPSTATTAPPVASGPP